MHKHVLIIDKISELRATIKATTKRRSRKRKYIQLEGTLTVEAGAQLNAANVAAEQEKTGQSLKGGRAAGAARQQRRCRRCNKTGHNSRTCGLLPEEPSDEE